MLLIVGTIVLLRSMSLDFDSVFYALKLGLIAAIVAGFFGYLIGNIFQSSKKKNLIKENNKPKKNKKNLLIDDILLEDMDQLDKEFE